MMRYYFLLPILLAACGKNEASSPVSTPYYPNLSQSIAETKSEAKLITGDEGSRVRAIWDHAHADSETWTLTTLFEISAHRKDLEKARDLEEFCPGYSRASSYQKDTCWLRLISAMAKFESSFRPKATYLEATGQTSVGLLMMDPRHCPNAPTLEKLQIAEPNIQCAIPRLALLVARDSMISGPKNSGGAAYWSVLREPYRFGNLFLGRKPHIQIYTRNYQAYKE